VRRPLIVTIGNGWSAVCPIRNVNPFCSVPVPLGLVLYHDSKFTILYVGLVDPCTKLSSRVPLEPRYPFYFSFPRPGRIVTFPVFILVHGPRHRDTNCNDRDVERERNISMMQHVTLTVVSLLRIIILGPGGCHRSPAFPP